MHSGRFTTLREAVAFYNGGRGHAVPEGEEMQLHWHIWDPGLRGAELDLIVAFLRTLTDETFVPAGARARAVRTDTNQCRCAADATRRGGVHRQEQP
jgi:cytochrome c peroxidase